ncbi:DUF1343 domain-containing protein, partial [bacterium]|nr:DUF1343 domain-containing protein [bacterium]
MSSIKLGIDVLLEENLDLVTNKKVALLSHASAVNKEYKMTLELLHEHPDITLIKLFAPEHGFYGTAQDMEAVSDATDSLTGLPTISLYGKTIETLTPKPQDLEDSDVLICDLQDIGSRYYTFIYTMALCMKVCGKLKKRVIILDRPNPLNGITVEGDVLDPNFSSFVGLYPLPVRHGMTIGELAQHFNETQNFHCDLTVIKMQGWQRDMYWDDTGLEFVPPSPNMPSLNAALVYPGMCLLEATELSEGRGTTKPFEWFGAPYIKAKDFAAHLNALNLEGVYFRPIHFKPSFQKWAGIECHGAQIHVTNRNTFKPYHTGLK